MAALGTDYVSLATIAAMQHKSSRNGRLKPSEAPNKH
jgi:hypothetical protein